MTAYYLGSRRWKPAVLQDLVFLQRGFDITKAEQKDGEIQVISSSGPSSRHNEAMAEGPGVIIGRKGSLGTVHYSEGDYWPHDTTLWSKSLNGNNPRFVYYALKCLGLERFNVGGANPTLNRNHIHGLPIYLADRKTQDNIAAVLSAYDDLIENNRRRIALLEEAARLLYREWFVHFRFPGHEQVKIIDGIPEGWDRQTLGEVADVRLGKMLDEKKNRGELRPYLANVNVRWGRFEFDNLREMRFEAHEVEKYGLMPGDIVMCEGGEPGRCAIWKDQVPGMMLQKALHRIRAHQGLDPRFLYHCLSFMAKSGRLAGLFTGATIKHLPREKLITVSLLTPPKGLVREFAERVSLLEAQIGTLETANRRAAQARDLILPRLMNGEIAV